MSSATLEQRVTELERLVKELIQNSGVSTREKDWRRSSGMFDGDAVMKEVIEEGQRVREEDRQQADS